MNKELKNEIKGNKNCDIKVKNILAPDDKLAKYNIFDEKIKDKHNIEKEFSKRIEYAEKIYSMQLPKELQDDFEIKSEKRGNDIDFLTVAKTKDAYEKFPLKIKFSYKLENVKGLEKFKSKNFFELTREMYEKQKGIIIENPYNVREFLGNIENPASAFTDIDPNAKSYIYIQPQPFPPAIAYNIKLFNNYFDFELEKVMLRIEEINEDVYTYSNRESKDDKFDIKIKLKFEKEKFHFTIAIKIKKDYIEDCKTVSDYIKYYTLIKDKESNFVFEFYEDNKIIFETKKIGTYKFSRKEYKTVEKELQLLEKMIFIEKRKNIKFKYNEKELLKNKNIINMLYNELQDKDYTITEPSTWLLYAYKDQININELKRVFEEKVLILIETNFKDLNIFSTDIKMKDHKLYMEECKINSIEEVDDKYYIKVTTSKVRFKLLDRRTL